jgi:hypothetical protein
MNCYTYQNSDSKPYSKFAIISDKADVREKGKAFFESHVFPTSGLRVFAAGGYPDKPPPSAVPFESREKLDAELALASDNEYCLALNFENLDLANFEYKVSVSVPAKFVPDTNKPVYNELVRLPNKGDWKKILSGGSSAVQPFIT